MKVIAYILNIPWTLIGLLLALVSIPKRIRFIDGAVVFNVRSFWWANLIWYMRGHKVRGITNGNVISLGPLEEENDLRHELIHVQQYMRLPLVYPFLYAVEVIKHGSSPENKYEGEAYQKSNSVFRGRQDNSIILIFDPEVLKMPIEENGEPMVDLHAFALTIDPRKSKASNSYFRARKSVGEKLLAAQKQLPAGVSLLIIEAHRPLSLQKQYFEEYSAELRELHPDWDRQRIYAEASKYVAPPEIIPPHSTGGAVDLTLVKDGIELDMGTRVNADPEESRNACFTTATNISKKAQANRKMLIDAMTAVGFINYPTEWWHWSYGDRYWAHTTKATNAIYGSIK